MVLALRKTLRERAILRLGHGHWQDQNSPCQGLDTLSSQTYVCEALTTSRGVFVGVIPTLEQ
jgi:hypothetical protein